MDIIEKLATLATESRLKKVPILSDEKAKWLAGFIVEHKPRSILELGTAVGYSGTILAHMGGQLTTIDCDRRALDVAVQTFAEHSIAAFLIEGDALEILKNLVEQKRRYDLVFVDFAKAKYLEAWPMVQAVCGGWVISDNIDNPKCAEYRKVLEQHDTTFFSFGDGISLTNMSKRKNADNK